MADHEDYEDVDPKPVEIHQPAPVESFKVIQAVAANLKATVTQLNLIRTVIQPTEANLKAIVSVNDFQTLIDEVKLLRNCNLLATGQAVLFHAGDDGDLEKGVIKSYTILNLGDYSGTTNITINAKIHALSNNCVKDNNTGLMWARYVPTADIGPATDGKLFCDQWTLLNKIDIKFTQVSQKINSAAGEFDILALCVGRKFTVAGSVSNNGTYTVTAITANDITVAEALSDEIAGAAVSIASVDDLVWDFKDQANTNSLGGHNDWRIPNSFEFSSLLTLGRANPCIDIATFPSTPTGRHWTSTTDPGYTVYGFSVDFSRGGIYAASKTRYKYNFRLVRG